MEFTIYKLHFTTPVHFGTGTLNTTAIAFCADTLFSALYIEALKAGMAQELYEMVRAGMMLFSDAFPYMEDCLFIPKPIKYIEPRSGERGNSIIKKKFKNLSYIPLDRLEIYLQGDMNPDDGSMHNLGFRDSQTMSGFCGDNEPRCYIVDNYVFRDGNGLYILVGYYEERCRSLLEYLLQGLSYVGIGGKRGAGKGRFRFETIQPDSQLLEMMRHADGDYMLLSTALPMRQEMERALDGASYLLQRRSGGVQSETYARVDKYKKNLYTMKAGACFTYRFKGDIYDVSAGGMHAVYRYAMGFFMGLPDVQCVNRHSYHMSI